MSNKGILIFVICKCGPLKKIVPGAFDVPGRHCQGFYIYIY